jgi:hypothetical protein
MLRTGNWASAGLALAFGGAVLLLAAAGPGAAVADARASFLPHRALYEMKLGRSKNGAEVADVNGRMAFEWRDDCDGWTVEQQYLLRFLAATGAVNDVASRYTTWESKDGNRYRFLVTKQHGGDTSNELDGEASQQPETGGEARFRKPEAKTFKLPAGTLFPSAHTFALIDKARAGTTFFPSRMFDGGELEGENPVTAVIGRPAMLDKPMSPELAERYWPIRLAFFSPDGNTAAPDYEMDVLLHENGIAHALNIDYGEYVIAVKLLKLEMLPAPAC